MKQAQGITEQLKVENVIEVKKRGELANGVIRFEKTNETDA
jgi:hypothetical protein